MRLDDTGVTLDSLDRPMAVDRTVKLELLSADRGDAELRRLSHKLRAAAREDGDASIAGLTPTLQSGLLMGARSKAPVDLEEAPPWDLAPTGRMAWGVTLLLAAGLALLLAGVGSLAWSIRLVDARAAHWGITAGLGGVGLLVVAIARLTARVWRNSRRLAVQLDGVTEHLEAMRGIAATSALVRGAERRA